MPKPTRLIQLLLLLLVLALAGYFRFSNLAENPGWYNDEGTVINIAANNLMGRSEYFGVTGSTLIAARTPLFPLLLAGIFRGSGVDIYPLRLLTAASGTISAALLFGLMLYINKPKISLLTIMAPIVYAIDPNAVLFSRLGFSYNLLTPLTILVFASTWMYWVTGKRPWLFVASGIIVAGIFSDLTMLYIGAATFLLVVFKKPRDLFVPLLIILIPFLVYILISYIAFGSSFMSDLFVVLTRSSQFPLLLQPFKLIKGYLELILFAPLTILAMTGIFLIPDNRNRLFVAVYFFVPFILIARNFKVIDESGYYLIPLLPMLAVGFAQFILFCMGKIVDFSRMFADYIHSLVKIRNTKAANLVTATVESLFILFMIITPLGYGGYLSLRQVETQMVTSFDELMLNPQDARSAVNYINQKVSKDDLVIASPALAWAIQANATDYHISIAASGNSTVHFPEAISSGRMRFDSNYNLARYVVRDPIWDYWNDNEIPGFSKFVALVSDWPMVFQAGNIMVYSNPQLDQ